MTDNSVLASFDSLWHYGVPTATPLQINSSTTPSSPSNLTRRSSCSVASSPAASESSDSSDVRSLQSLFSVMDEDGDGQLSLCDLHSLLTKLGITPQYTDLKSFIEHASCSDDGIFLDFPQFAQLHASLFGTPDDCSTEDPVAECKTEDCFDDELVEAFSVYDTNHDGFISAAELAVVLLELGLLPPADHGCIDAHVGRCQAYIDCVDLDGDGMVNLADFKHMMRNNHLSVSG